ncbi:HD domain-containing protein [Clostridium algidicarnis]|uniref:HD domain-containing protein n=1 Tax=Clostridium algidicarnis TaxID=37659 RepID=UPI001CF2ABF8|nr:HD domain-containing protein [Clostridium algidicarnis]MCB2286609.1 HD domain-containing protein [Clostridium algidicarnis]
MDIKVIEEIAYKMMVNRKAHIEREKGFIYYHGLRVSKISLKLRKIILKEDCSHDDMIFVACLFHDIAKGIEPHGKYGAILARDILNQHCTEYEINEIANIIHNHSLRKKNNDYSEYVKIVQDSDILDHFGSIEIWMNFLYYAHKDKPISNSLEFYDSQYTFEVEKCRELLNYDVSRKIFDEKVSFATSFIDRFRRENEGEIFI